MKFRHFLNISYFAKRLNLNWFGNQPQNSWEKGKFVKIKKSLKIFENDCLENFPVFFMSL